MNIHAALRHERSSAQHARNLQESNMWCPAGEDAAIWNAPLEEDPPLTKEELQMREHQLHVERIADIVPYWIKCVNAAANGEELRLEPFLNSLQDVSDSWVASIPNPWGTGSGAWDNRGDENRWVVPPAARSMASSGQGSRSRTGSPSIAIDGHSRASCDINRMLPSGYAFVEDIARQEAVTDVDRKWRMHTFFEMPTQEKVKKIDELVRYLQSATV
ncbi:hypothetical protein C8R45DRAFT_31233 [Mycena sanguinolenta]|nr:hypothetical protein C8R45DRAFT_31233 [Mycena sanguinolenta]